MKKTRSGLGRPFQAGNKYGKGRPAGSRNKATIALEALLDGEGEAMMRKAIELALAGSETALRLCLERLIPPRRERLVQLRLPSDLTTAKGTSRAASAVLKAVAQGEITPGEAVQLANVLEVRRKVIDSEELESRIDELERTTEAKQAQSDLPGRLYSGPGNWAPEARADTREAHRAASQSVVRVGPGLLGHGRTRPARQIAYQPRSSAQILRRMTQT